VGFGGVVLLVVVGESAALLLLRRLERLMDLGSCRGEADACVLGGLRGSCGAAAAGRPLGIAAEGEG
jgi:hypothetical protein